MGITKEVGRGINKDESNVVKDFSDSTSDVRDSLERVERPWGSYRVLGSGDGFQVKEILIRKGERTSLQSHQYRSENWILIEGSGEVFLDGRVLDVKAGEILHIPLHSKHRVKANTDILRFIEVQSGTYFGEDDIIRYEDDYNRA